VKPSAFLDDERFRVIHAMARTTWRDSGVQDVIWRTLVTVWGLRRSSTPSSSTGCLPCLSRGGVLSLNCVATWRLRAHVANTALCLATNHDMRVDIRNIGRFAFRKAALRSTGSSWRPLQPVSSADSAGFPAICTTDRARLEVAPRAPVFV